MADRFAVLPSLVVMLRVSKPIRFWQVIREVKVLLQCQIDMSCVVILFLGLQEDLSNKSMAK
jgi:hypothetical protein